MLNDYTPHAAPETNDFGKTWKRVADGTTGIPAGHATRVVREDPDMPGLLVAGTEYGNFYISYRRRRALAVVSDEICRACRSWISSSTGTT